MLAGSRSQHVKRRRCSSGKDKVIQSLLSSDLLGSPIQLPQLQHDLQPKPGPNGVKRPSASHLDAAKEGQVGTRQHPECLLGGRLGSYMSQTDRIMLSRPCEHERAISTWTQNFTHAAEGSICRSCSNRRRLHGLGHGMLHLATTQSLAELLAS